MERATIGCPPRLKSDKARVDQAWPWPLFSCPRPLKKAVRVKYGQDEARVIGKADSLSARVKRLWSGQLLQAWHADYLPGSVVRRSFSYSELSSRNVFGLSAPELEFRQSEITSKYHNVESDFGMLPWGTSR